MSHETTDAVEILHKRYYAGKPDRIAALEEERSLDGVARQLHELRTQAGLTQRALARKIGTSAGTICRLESASYRKHSLTTLRRVARALNCRVNVTFVPNRVSTRAKNVVPR